MIVAARPSLAKPVLGAAAQRHIAPDAPIKLNMEHVSIFYGARKAVRDVTLDIPANAVTAFIGPSGCGKSTILRCFDRMNDLIPNARVEGSVRLDGEESNDPAVPAVEVRRRVGLVFQRPNPFPMERAPGEVVAAASASARPAPRAPARESLDRELRQIKDDVLRMGSLVEEAIRGAVASLVSHDADAALAVITSDDRINDMQRRIASAITTTIATQSPVARDLRFLMALDHVSYELERMGDHASSVAKQARKLAPLPPLRRYIDLPEMGELVARQVHAILLALVEVDEAAARLVAADDDEIDHLYRRISTSYRPDAGGPRTRGPGHAPALRGVLRRAHR